jgi:putative urate catabolism protein
MTQTPYPRDLIGYVPNPPKANWPGGARIAIQIVLNYEEGGENCILHGDAASERFLSEIVSAEAYPNMRHANMESIYEFGSRAGFWRLHRLFTGRGLPVTVFGVATALARNPAAVAAMKAADWEIASHGLKWVEYRDVPEAVERDHIAEAIRLHQEVTGARPNGFYQGRTSENTRKLVAEYGGFLYDADDYSDDLPFWSRYEDNHLIVPYTLDTNDMRFAAAQGFNCGDQFYTYLKDAFDALYEEGEAAPKMLSIGMHARVLGRPGRIQAMKRFLDYVAKHDRVWVARRDQIAKHWRAEHAQG